jgi:hypothetical protein
MGNTTVAAVDGNPDDMPYSGKVWKVKKRGGKREQAK